MKPDEELREKDRLIAFLNAVSEQVYWLRRMLRDDKIREAKVALNDIKWLLRVARDDFSESDRKFHADMIASVNSAVANRKHFED